jgi:short-subunit dehydrogenase
VARRQERLQALAAELRQRHGIEAGFLTADLADPEQVANVEQLIAGLDNLELLVQAAGFGTIGWFTTIPVEGHLDMLHVHDTAAVRLTHAALAGMVARRCGAVVLVSSVVAFTPMVGNVTYCASKAYLVAFAEGLQGELRGSGVQVQALCPGFTDTEFHETPAYGPSGIKERIPRFLWMSSEAVVAASLKALERGEVVCVPGGIYRAFAAVARLGVVNAIARLVLHRFRKPAHLAQWAEGAKEPATN